MLGDPSKPPKPKIGLYHSHWTNTGYYNTWFAFIFAANKIAFYDFGAQRRKAAKIFACFLSGQIWAKNMTRAVGHVKL
jgi:hypothetical protein